MIIYDSLLKEIINLTPLNHPDLEDLINSQKMIGSAIRQADRVVEMKKNTNKVLKIQTLLNVSNIAEPHRRYVYDGEVVYELNQRNLKERLLFLFNDIIILAKPKRKKYEIEWSLKLIDIQLIDVEDRLKFQIKESNSNLIHTLESDDKPTWLYHIKLAIKNLGAFPQELFALRNEDQIDLEINSGEKNIQLLHDPKYLSDLIIKWSEMKTEDVILEVKATAIQLKKNIKFYSN